MNCPVCNKGGLPINATFCPQCDSDFSHIVALDSFTLNNGGNKKKKSLIAILISIIILLTIYIAFNWHSSPKEISNQFLSGKDNNDSIYILKKEIKKYVQSIDSLTNVKNKNNEYFNYKVNKGNNLSNIFRIFSLKENQINDFLHLNQIANKDFILEGQILKIPILQK